MDPNPSALPSELESDADSCSPRAGSGLGYQNWRMQLPDTVRAETIRQLEQKLEGRVFTPGIAAPYAELQILEQATDEHEYDKQIHDLFHSLELFPKAHQRFPGSNNPVPNQYQINQDLGMMPPQGAPSPSRNVVMNQPSTSRQQQGQPLLQGLANESRTMPTGPAGCFPVGMYSDTQRKQQEMLPKSQNQMVFQQQPIVQQSFQMSQTQQNPMVFQQQQMIPEFAGSGMTAAEAASAMGMQSFIQQQQLHQKHQVYTGTGSCSSPVDLTENSLEEKQDLLKKTCGVQLTEIAQELLLVSGQVDFWGAQYPSYEYDEVVKKTTAAKKCMDPLLVMLSASVDTLSIELKDKLHYFEEFMPEVVKQAEMAINQAQLYLQQYPPLQPHQKPQAGPLSDRNRNTILPLQQQQQELGPNANQTGNMSEDKPFSYYDDW